MALRTIRNGGQPLHRSCVRFAYVANINCNNMVVCQLGEILLLSLPDHPFQGIDLDIPLESLVCRPEFLLVGGNSSGNFGDDEALANKDSVQQVKYELLGWTRKVTRQQGGK